MAGKFNKQTSMFSFQKPWHEYIVWPFQMYRYGWQFGSDLGMPLWAAAYFVYGAFYTVGAIPMFFCRAVGLIKTDPKKSGVFHQGWDDIATGISNLVKSIVVLASTVFVYLFMITRMLSTGITYISGNRLSSNTIDSKDPTADKLPGKPLPSNKLDFKDPQSLERWLQQSGDVTEMVSDGNNKKPFWAKVLEAYFEKVSKYPKSYKKHPESNPFPRFHEVCKLLLEAGMPTNQSTYKLIDSSGKAKQKTIPTLLHAASLSCNLALIEELSQRDTLNWEDDFKVTYKDNETETLTPFEFLCRRIDLTDPQTRTAFEKLLASHTKAKSGSAKQQSRNNIPDVVLQNAIHYATSIEGQVAHKTEMLEIFIDNSPQLTKSVLLEDNAENLVQLVLNATKHNNHSLLRKCFGLGEVTTTIYASNKSFELPYIVSHAGVSGKSKDKRERTKQTVIEFCEQMNKEVEKFIEIFEPEKQARIKAIKEKAIMLPDAKEKLIQWYDANFARMEFDKLFSDIMLDAVKRNHGAIILEALVSVHKQMAVIMKAAKAQHSKNSLLHEAIKSANVEAVKFLVKQGADLLAKNEEGLLPWQVKLESTLNKKKDAKERHTECRQFLRKSTFETCAMFVIKCIREEKLDELKTYLDLYSTDATAILNTKVDISAYEIKANTTEGKEIPLKRVKPASVACVKGDAKTARMLFQQGAKPSKKLKKLELNQDVRETIEDYEAQHVTLKKLFEQTSESNFEGLTEETIKTLPVLLNLPSSPKAPNDTLLMRTLLFSKPEAALRILAHTQTLPPQPEGGKPFLFYACELEQDDSALAEALIKQGAKVETTFKVDGIKGFTALHAACGSGNTNIAKALLKLDAKWNKNRHDDTEHPVAVAVRKGHTDTALTFLGDDYKKQFNRHHLQQIVSAASSTANKEILERCFAVFPKKTEDMQYWKTTRDSLEYTPLHLLCKNADATPDMVEMLTKRKVKIDKKVSWDKYEARVLPDYDKTALQLAASRNEAVALKLIELDEKASKSFRIRFDAAVPDDIAMIAYKKGFSDLYKKAIEINKECLEYQDESEGSEGFTLLHHAARKGDIELAKQLIKNGAKVEEEASYYSSTKREFLGSGNTPLAVACIAGQVEMVKYLLKNSAQHAPAYQTNDRDETPLSMVASQECSETRTQLLELLVTSKGFKIDNGFCYGSGSKETTLLERAVKNYDEALVDFCLDKGADPEHYCNTWSPLELAGNKLDKLDQKPDGDKKTTMQRILDKLYRVANPDNYKENAERGIENTQN